MSADFAITSQRVVLPEGIRPATIMIKEGLIQDVQAFQNNASTDQHYQNVGNAVIMPGIIDAHVHINEPGRTDWEGFDTATRAAAAGGITSLIDMPLNSSPVTTTVEALQQKIKAAKGKLHVNCGFYGGLVPANADDLSALLESDVLGIKAFLVHSGIDEFPNISKADLQIAMPQIAAAGIPLLVHCELEPGENKSLTDSIQPLAYATWLASRPDSWELEAITQMIQLCQQTNCRTHIVHLATAKALPHILEARKAAVPLTVESCAHYLYFAAEQISDGNTAFKCAPPIRHSSHREALWQALDEGLLDFISSDHSPAPPAIKQLDSRDFMKAWGGIAGVQFLLPASWTAAQQRGFTIDQIAAWLSTNPARFLGLQERKGQIAPGYDADLCIWNPEASFTVQKEDIIFRHPISPYIGERLLGSVMQTWVGGQKVFDNGTFTKLQHGRIILRNGNA